MDDLITVQIFARVIVDDSFPLEVRERAQRLQATFERMKQDNITDPSLMNDILDAIETLSNVYRRARAIGNV